MKKNAKIGFLKKTLLTTVRLKNYNKTMNRILKIIFTLALLLSIYHLVRDLLTNFGIHNYILDFAHRPHLWCGKFCPWITVPPEIFNIIASLIILKRNRVGLLGFLVLIQPPLWILAVLLP